MKLFINSILHHTNLQYLLFRIIINKNLTFIYVLLKSLEHL